MKGLGRWILARVCRSYAGRAMKGLGRWIRARVWWWPQCKVCGRRFRSKPLKYRSWAFFCDRTSRCVDRGGFTIGSNLTITEAVEQVNREGR